ncbi:GNAT family N-acetyltransferase, partial [bacterium]|nr:GNAT family N-acetyltransferase [bacterium]
EWMSSYKYPYFQYFVIERKKKIFGFDAWALYDLRNCQTIWELAFIAVKRSYQKRGIGKELFFKSLDILISNCRSRKWSLVGIIVEVDEQNKIACHFYDNILFPCQKFFIREVWDDEGKFVYFKKLKK